MVTRILLLAAATLALMASLSPAALGEKPEKPGKPTTTTTIPDGTTVPDDGLTTCLDVGPAWNHGAWDPDQQAYTAETLPICIDLDADPTHRTWTHWNVTWSGTSARATKQGAEAILMFEEQLHVNSHASSEIALASRATTGDGSWEAPLDFTAAEPTSLVFVAMPHSGAKWTSFSVTVEPVLP